MGVSTRGKMRCLTVVLVILLQMLMDIDGADKSDITNQECAGRTVSFPASGGSSNLFRGSLVTALAALSYFVYFTGTTASGAAVNLAQTNKAVLEQLGINIENGHQLKKEIDLEDKEELLNAVKVIGDYDESTDYNAPIGQYEKWLNPEEVLRSKRSAQLEDEVTDDSVRNAQDLRENHDNVRESESGTSRALDQSTTERTTTTVCKRIRDNILHDYQKEILPQVQKAEATITLTKEEADALDTKILEMQGANCTTFAEAIDKINEGEDDASTSQYKFKDMSLLKEWAKEISITTDEATDTEELESGVDCGRQKRKLVHAVKEELEQTLLNNSTVVQVDEKVKKDRVKKVFQILEANDCGQTPFMYKDVANSNSKFNLTIQDPHFINRWAKHNELPLIPVNLPTTVSPTTEKSETTPAPDCDKLLDALLEPWKGKIKDRLAAKKTALTIDSIKNTYRMHGNYDAMVEANCPNIPFEKPRQKEGTLKVIYEFKDIPALKQWLIDSERTTTAPTTTSSSEAVNTTEENDMATTDQQKTTEIQDEHITMNPECENLLEKLLTTFSDKINKKFSVGKDSIKISKGADKDAMSAILVQMKALECPNYPIEEITSEFVQNKQNVNRQKLTYKFRDVEYLKEFMSKMSTARDQNQLFSTTTKRTEIPTNILSDHELTTVFNGTTVLSSTDLISTDITAETITTTKSPAIAPQTCEDLESDLIRMFADNIKSALSNGEKYITLDWDEHHDNMLPSMQKLKAKKCGIDYFIYKSRDYSTEFAGFKYKMSKQFRDKYDLTSLQKFIEDTTVPSTL